MTPFYRFAGVAAAALLVSCSDDPAGPGPGASVDVIDIAFDPDEVAVTAGETVTWTWQGSLDHNVTFDDPSINASTTKNSGTFQVTFNTPGTYTYVCTVHPVQMIAEVVVQ